MKDPERKKAIKLYSYDANKFSFPGHIKNMASPPEDLTGELVNQHARFGLPAIFIFPAANKHPPYQQYEGGPYASDMLKYISGVITHDLNVRLQDFEELGHREIAMFFERIREEGIIKLPEEEMKDEHTELWYLTYKEETSKYNLNCFDNKFLEMHNSIKSSSSQKAREFDLE